MRASARFLVTIGACATSGGIQALRNWADTEEYLQTVYARPEYIRTLETSTAIADQKPLPAKAGPKPSSEGERS